jgi:hypothetical protein
MMTDRKPDDDAVHEPPPVPERPPEAGGGPVGPRPHPGDYGATEDEQRRVVGRPREEAP